jgi:hypothetical protein
LSQSESISTPNKKRQPARQHQQIHTIQARCDWCDLVELVLGYGRINQWRAAAVALNGFTGTSVNPMLRPMEFPQMVFPDKI